ncbi:MAG: type I-MYXAN CRISPR-associated protein Cas6/Cmx6 [Gammaproteobacteria bacterium]|nr:type I-MYXAN CRISPR-associated protein Cas6/Cmx6 [Gammaproteobacteria bacterium]
MVWQEEKPFVAPDDIVDLSFRINCKCLPIEHAHTLSRALHEALPWLGKDDRVGIHLVHVAESGNGWMRPVDAENDLLLLSRRTRMTLRLPKDRLDEARQLKGVTLDIDGYSLEVSDSSVRELSISTTLFSRYIIADEEESEQVFTASVVSELGGMGIPVRKLLCGRTHTLNFPDRKVFTRSLMIADLEPEQSVKLQQVGLREGRKYGCGLFLPHKGIDPVGSMK